MVLGGDDDDEGSNEGRVVPLRLRSEGVMVCPILEMLQHIAVCFAQIINKNDVFLLVIRPPLRAGRLQVKLGVLRPSR